MDKLLNGFGEVLQDEADVKINKAIELFNRCSDSGKDHVLFLIGLPKEKLSDVRLRDSFDTAELLDTIDDIIVWMEEFLLQEEDCKIGELTMRREGDNWVAYYKIEPENRSFILNLYSCI